MPGVQGFVGLGFRVLPSQRESESSLLRLACFAVFFLAAAKTSPPPPPKGELQAAESEFSAKARIEDPRDPQTIVEGLRTTALLINTDGF